MKYDIGTPVAYIGEAIQILGVIYKRENVFDEFAHQHNDQYYIEWQDDFNIDQEYTEGDIDVLYQSFRKLEDES